MVRPRLLDLFCCAGGASMGYSRAGFDVTGVDIVHQPDYRFPFIKTDAMEVLRQLAESGTFNDYALIHASPPCQGYSDLKTKLTHDYPMLIEPVRDLLKQIGLPYIIENVDGAPLIDPVVLCGTMFPELRVLRHRLFESNLELTAPPHGPHPLVFTHDKRKAHHGKLDQDTSYVQVTGGGNCSIKNAREAMGIGWMSKRELNEAIPPAYTEFLGRQAIRQISERQEMAA